MFSGLQRQHPQQVQGCGVLRVECQHIAVGSLEASGKRPCL